MKRILVVDDQPNIRQLIGITLRAAGRQILEAESGEQAIALAHRARPDLIIMDLMMPGGMDGLAATEQLKADPGTRDCPVLILTAKAQREERERALGAGADDFLTKPFRLDILQQKVTALVGI
jgi:CheY-like chemotaxis protein